MQYKTCVQFREGRTFLGNLAEFDKKCSEWLTAGWLPVGGITIISDGLMQAFKHDNILPESIPEPVQPPSTIV